MPHFLPHLKRLALTAAGVALTLFALLTLARLDEPATAADGETAQLISYMNSYRAQAGASPLTAGGQINADAQAIAQEVANSGSYGAMYNTGYNTSFGSYGYPTASCLWNAWLADPFYLDYIDDPKYTHVGVGRAFGNHFNPMWVVLLDKDGQKSGSAAAEAGTASGGAQPAGGSICPSGPASTPTPSPVQTPPATPTPTLGPSQTPSSTTPSSTTPSSTAAASPTDNLTNSPSPTGVPDIGGDVDCSGSVDLLDGIEVLKVIGGADSHAPCITASGPDCTGFLTPHDALVLFRYLGDLPVDLPDGCPAIGAVTTPTPGPSPSVTPTPTPTPTPTSDSTPDPGAAMDHCWVAPVVYDMTYQWLLEGDYTCAPANGAAYTCNFPAGSNAVECATDTLAHYSCYVWADPGIDVPCASSLSTGGDYLCHQGESSITCTAPSAPTYVCTVADQLITCTGPATFAWSPPAPVP